MIVSVTFVDPLPAGSDEGLKEAVAPAGRPVTEKLTGAGNVVPFVGVREKAKFAVPPGETVCAAGPDVAKARS